MNITLNVARDLIDAAEEKAVAQSLNPLAIVVLDQGGHIVASIRQDGTSIKRLDIAYGKAFGALALGVGSRSLMERAELQPYFVAAAGAAIGGSLIPVPGGVLLRNDGGETVGAIGISGDTSDNDEIAAVAGALAVGFDPVP